MKNVIFGVVCTLIGFVAGKYLYDFKRHLRKTLKTREWREYLAASANLFRKAEEVTIHNNEESQ